MIGTSLTIIYPVIFVLLSDCAVCIEGYGRGVSNTCHPCHGIRGWLLIAAGALFTLVMTLLIFIAVVFLIGGPDAVNVVRLFVIRWLSTVNTVYTCGSSASEIELTKRLDSNNGELVDPIESTIAHVDYSTSKVQLSGGEGDIDHRRRSSSMQYERDESESTCGRTKDAAVWGVTGVKLSPATRRRGPFDAEEVTHTRLHVRRVSRDNACQTGEVAPGSGWKCKYHGFGQKTKHSSLKLPIDKLKILLAVWQIIIRV